MHEVTQAVLGMEGRQFFEGGRDPTKLAAVRSSSSRCCPPIIKSSKAKSTPDRSERDLRDDAHFPRKKAKKDESDRQSQYPPPPQPAAMSSSASSGPDMSASRAAQQARAAGGAAARESNWSVFVSAFRGPSDIARENRRFARARPPCDAHAAAAAAAAGSAFLVVVSRATVSQSYFVASYCPADDARLRASAARLPT